MRREVCTRTPPTTETLSNQCRPVPQGNGQGYFGKYRIQILSTLEKICIKGYLSCISIIHPLPFWDPFFPSVHIKQKRSDFKAFHQGYKTLHLTQLFFTIIFSFSIHLFPCTFTFSFLTIDNYR